MHTRSLIYDKLSQKLRVWLGSSLVTNQQEGLSEQHCYVAWIYLQQ